MHSEVHISLHTCTNNYLRCTKHEVHDHVLKYAIRCTKKHVSRFLILEALVKKFKAIASTALTLSIFQGFFNSQKIQ